MTLALPLSRLRLLPAFGLLLLLALAAPAALSMEIQQQIYQARDAVMPALVHIEPILEVYRLGERGHVAVTGSGVIFSPDGYVLTNNHVVEHATSVKCTLSSQAEVQAVLIGRDPLTDLAILKLQGEVPAKGWPHATLGDSDQLQVGQYVLALGSPLGLARSLSVGVISSLNRYIPQSQLPSGSPTGLFNTWIQTDAAINPGNSGGPLVSLAGKVIGINARAVPIFGENIGFAIPINLAREIAKALMKHGEVTRSWIGAHWQSMKSLNSFFGLGEARGVLVSGVVPGSPADSAGLEAGDIVLTYSGQPVSVWFEEDMPAFEKRVADSPVGEEIPLQLLRQGNKMSLSIRTRAQAKTEGDQKENREWGFSVREVTDDAAVQLHMKKKQGVLISGVKPGSFGAEAGLHRDDLILSMEDLQIDNLEHWSQLYQQMIEEKRSQVLLTVRRGPARYFYVIKPVYNHSQARSGRLASPGAEGRP